MRITADLPTLHADLLYTQLHAFASPRRDHLSDDPLGVIDRRDPDTGERVPYARLLAQGFCSLLERLPRDVVPAHGGDSASLVVMIDHDRLTEELGVARLGTGQAITAGEARRLACNAGILPMVLSGKSQPLDVGRKRRFHTPAMRKALAVRDRECRVAGATSRLRGARPTTSSRGPRRAGRRTSTTGCCCAASTTTELTTRSTTCVDCPMGTYGSIGGRERRNLRTSHQCRIRTAPSGYAGSLRGGVPGLVLTDVEDIDPGHPA